MFITQVLIPSARQTILVLGNKSSHLSDNSQTISAVRWHCITGLT